MDERPDQQRPAAEEDFPVAQVVRRAGRFSREFLATMIALVTTAFGVVVALAWNTALSTALTRLSKNSELVGLFTYAVIVTVVAVFTVIFLGRLATRIGAAPIEFKYPAPEKKD